MKFERPVVLVLIGASVFAIGASLVVLSLHSDTTTPTAGRHTPLPVAGTTLSQAQAVNTSEVAIPIGDQAVAVTPANGTAGLAGYLGPGDVVDVYASAKAIGPLVPVVPCAAVVATDVPVLDVSVQTPEYRGHTGTARSIPGSVTVLLAATSAQSALLVFAAQNEQIYLTEVPRGGGSRPTGPCAGGAA